jgi:putative acetyltransferase
MKIITELPYYRPAVLELNRRAFKGEEEVQLIENLQHDGDVLASLVAIDGDEVVGHILFSPLHVSVNGARIVAAALAPMAVSPSRQSQGIGSQLITRGIAEMKSAGQAAIIVLGHIKFYSRFGFRHDFAANLVCDYNQYDEFMGLELVKGSLAGMNGTCRYAKAFSKLAPD